MNPLSAEQVATYWRDGALSGVPVLPRSFVDGAVADLHRRIAAAGGAAWTDRDYRPWDHGEDHPLVGWMDAVARQRAVLDAVAAVLGPDLLIRNCDLFWKEPGRSRGIAWHRDTAVTGPEADHLLTAWIGLTPSTADNGALRFRLGSHRVELTDGPRDNRSLNLTPAAVAQTAHCPVLRNEMPAGSMSLHHFSTVHASARNRTDAPRIGFVVRFMRPAASRAVAESGTATRVRGRDRHGHFQLTKRFPLGWVG